jgi:hypothetical protein
MYILLNQKKRAGEAVQRRPSTDLNAWSASMAKHVLPELTPELEARFWDYVDRRGPGECWPSKKYLRSNGYSYMQAPSEGRNRDFGLHIIALVVSGNSVQGMHALHKCDNKNCYNPAHLEWGTHKENMRQCFERHVFKRNPVQGVQNKFALLTDDKVREIRASTEATGVLAKRYGVCCDSIYKARTRRRWKHVK